MMRRLLFYSFYSLTLKSYIYRLSPIRKYEISRDFAKIFTKKDVVNECRNLLEILELCLICSFTDARLERMFSRMIISKNDLRSNLGRDQLESLFRINEEDPLLECFNIWIRQSKPGMLTKNDD